MPNLYVDIAATIEDKIKSMACLPTELRPFPHPRSLEGIRICAAREGTRVGIHYAEPLCVLRDIIRSAGTTKTRQSPKKR